MKFQHISVLFNECIDGLDIKTDGIYVDGTLGGGGHSLGIVERLGEGGRLIAIDKDQDALCAAAERLLNHKDKITFIHDDFKNTVQNLDNLGIDKVDGILLDLGVSSYQIDNAERGFSYMADAPLDMRMDREQFLTAFNIVNEYNEIDIAKILWEYGEEKFSKKIAANIVKAREKQSIRTTAELAKIVEESIPAKFRYSGGNPCKRTFQALRIEVNGELENLKETIMQLALKLKNGGRICVISFHSLEDRAVKQAFAELEKPCICPPHQPICTCNKQSDLKLITKKPITANADETNQNKRSASAKLRIAQRITE